jgi:hypothetical protein
MVHSYVGSRLQAQVAWFVNPLTRMLLASNGLTARVLAAPLGTTFPRASA